jgi:uncharacterized protein (TIGR02145 family)
MKKIFTLILGITLAYSCSTSSDGNGNSTTTVVPFAPSNLTGTVASTTQINLSWTDNSTNETGFKIERKTGTGTYTIIGTTATDITSFSDTGLTPSTSYTYRVYSNNSVGNSLTYSNELTLTTASLINLPTLTTTVVSSINTTTAISGGTISSDGGASIIARGVCWSTSSNPNISLNTKTINGTGIGAFTSNITGLVANTTYYIKAYATNSVGTAYGTELSFTTLNIPNVTATDVDGNVYQTVTICNQVWTKSNLNVSRYRNGDIITQVISPSQWVNLTTGAWCYYNYNSANGTVYGKLYNWYAVNDPRGLAPQGWHIPSDTEWITLSNCLGGELSAGSKMKEIGTTHWISPNTDATNSSGFTALPAGCNMNNGVFANLGSQAFFWSSTENSSATYYAKSRFLIYNNTYLANDQVEKYQAYSIRCVKD